MFTCYSHHLQTGTDEKKKKKSIWAVGTVIHGAYIVAQNFSIPLQVQPQVFAALATVSWCQCMYYGRGYSLKSVLAIFVVLCCIFAGFEVGSVYALWVRFTALICFVRVEFADIWIVVIRRDNETGWNGQSCCMGIFRLSFWLLGYCESS